MRVACRWIDSSHPVAAKHYLQVTDDHFAKAAPNPVQQPTVLSRTGSQSELAPRTQAPLLQRDAVNCQKVPKAKRLGRDPYRNNARRFSRVSNDATC